jgi:hypothetical protein
MARMGSRSLCIQNSYFRTFDQGLRFRWYEADIADIREILYSVTHADIWLTNLRVVSSVNDGQRLNLNTAAAGNAECGVGGFENVPPEGGNAVATGVARIFHIWVHSNDFSMGRGGGMDRDW